MIRIKYCGRMGNSLLQYAFARILSKELGHYLPPHPIVGFPNTYKEINLDKKNSEKEGWLTLAKRNLWNTEEIRKLMGDRKNIFIKSSCANYGNFNNYRNEIRDDWFCIEQPYNKDRLSIDNGFFLWAGSLTPTKITNITNDDLIVHVRLGDVVGLRNRLLTFDYFDIILRNIKANRLFITSDSIQHPLLRPFDKYSPIYLSLPNSVQTFNFIRLFNRIAISQSSYSWWASYLSNAKEIYYPVTSNGLWSVTSRNDEDYRVNEERYIYVSQKHSKIMGRFNEVKEW